MHEQLALHIGSDVRGCDTRIGTVRAVAVRPMALLATHLLVRSGWIARTERLVPIGMIAGATRAAVSIRSSQDASHLEPVHDIPAPIAEWATPLLFAQPLGIAPLMHPRVLSKAATITERRLPAGTVLISNTTTVLDADGQNLGTVDTVVVDAHDGEVTHLRLSAGWSSRKTITIPLGWAVDVADPAIQIAWSRPEVVAVTQEVSQ